MNEILCGHVLEKLRTLPDNSVQCVVTSPPYWGLRDYGIEGQLGLEDTPELYMQRMVEVFREVFRVLREDGTLWLNIGDSYGCAPGTRAASVKPKDLVGIPWLLAFALRADGWYLRSEIIWHKLNPMPESVTDRPTKSHEQIFLLTKSANYYYDAEAIKEPVAESTANDKRGNEDGRRRERGFPGGASNGGTRLGSGSTRNARSVWSFNENRRYELPDGTVCIVSEDCPIHGRRSSKDTHKIECSEPKMTGLVCSCKWIIPQTHFASKDIWSFASQSFKGAHFATFPEELPRRCILAGTSEYGACPKCGTPWKRIVKKSGGTTGKGWTDHKGDLTEGMSQVDYRPGSAVDADGNGYRVETLGWQPGCKCGETETRPCVVLDCFMGSGTVAEVAAKLGRNWMGIELNPKYIELAKERLGIFADIKA